MTTTDSAASGASAPPNVADVEEAMRDVVDPELGINVVDLGLVYCARRTEVAIAVELTLTSRACPLGELVMAEVRECIAARFPDTGRLDVKLVWDPLWTPDRITDSGYAQLGRERKTEMI